jgi:hypothetical protein
MKKHIILASILLGIIASSLAIFFNYKDEITIKQTVANKLYNQRKSEVNTIISQKENFLKTFAKYLASAKPVIEGYLENNRTKIINFVSPLYKELYPEYIEEIHYFKPPAMDFVNFANLKHYGGDASKVRSDILWVNTSFKPSVHFYVCRMYPGLRATYPIIYKNKMLGSVSFGININFLIKILKNMNASDISIYLNNKTLKNYLSSKAYEKYKRYPSYKYFRVIGNITKNIDFKNNIQIIDNSLYSIIQLDDFFGNLFAYIVIYYFIKKY